MTSPAPAVDMVPVFGKFMKLDGTPHSGSIRFTIATRVTDNTDRVIFPSGSVFSVSLDSYGFMTVPLPAVDDPDNSPDNWSIKVEEKFTAGGGATYYIQPRVAMIASGGLDLSTVLVPANASPSPTALRGVAGGVAALDSDGDVVDSEGNKLILMGGGGGGVSQADLDDLAATKADATDLNTVKTQLAAKANAADLAPINQALTAKANTTDLAPISAALSAKANAADLTTASAIAAAGVRRARIVSRFESDARAKLPLASGGSVALVGALDASLTKTASWDARTSTGVADNTSRLATAAELAAFPVDTGCPDAAHYIYRSGASDNGFHFVIQAPDTSTVPASFVYSVTKYRFRTNSPKAALGFFALSGVANSYKVYIDGQPTSLRPMTPGYIDYLTFTFTDGLFHEVEVRTSAMMFGAFWNPIYDLVKPETPDPRLRIYTVGDSYSAPRVWNDTTAVLAADTEGLVQGIEDYLGGGDHYIDAVSGTGFVARATGAAYGPNNNYVDRMPAMRRAAPRIDLLLIPNGAVNDIAQGKSQASIAAAIRQYIAGFRALNPTATIVYGTGYTAPVQFGALGPQYRALMTQLQTDLADLGVYYVDTSTWITGTGRNTAKTGDGNADWIVGDDGSHPTGIGNRYLQSRFAQKVRKALADDGSLLNTVI